MFGTMSTEEQDDRQKRNNRVLGLAHFFDSKASSESNESQSDEYLTTYTSQQETIDIEVRNIIATFKLRSKGPSNT